MALSQIRVDMPPLKTCKPLRKKKAHIYRVYQRPKTSGFSYPQWGGSRAFLFATCYGTMGVSCRCTLPGQKFDERKRITNLTLSQAHRKHFIHEDAAASPCLLEMGDRTSIDGPCQCAPDICKDPCHLNESNCLYKKPRIHSYT